MCLSDLSSKDRKKNTKTKYVWIEYHSDKVIARLLEQK